MSHLFQPGHHRTKSAILKGSESGNIAVVGELRDSNFIGDVQNGGLLFDDLSIMVS